MKPIKPSRDNDNNNEIDLYCIKIPIPTGFHKNVEPVGFYYKSIGRIMDDKSPYENIVMEQWYTRQILNYLKWEEYTMPTFEIMVNALKLLISKNIKPEGCIYTESDENEDYKQS